MISPPMRPAGVTRTASTGSALAGAAAASGNADPGTAAVDALVDARIAALVSRATTPEDEALERQREEFDTIARAQAESDREINALRDMAMDQMKQDDELLKKWIELI